MVLALPDTWFWDFWFAERDGEYHIFTLQAPRALMDQNKRHWNVSIAHAKSSDLRNWTMLPTALAPGPPGAWDDYTTWTGCVYGHAGTFHMFYTGSCRAEQGLKQRIGLAVSRDLEHWERHPGNPVLTLDERWYDPLDLDLWHDQAWRDPWIYRHPGDNLFYAAFTARANHGPADARGVIGLARSPDLYSWEVLPPLTAPGEFGYLEVPQLLEINGKWILLFSAPTEFHAQARLDRGLPQVSGTFCCLADSPDGPFDIARARILAADPVRSLYSGRMIQTPSGWMFLAVEEFSIQGGFIGRTSDPMPVTFTPDGYPSVDWQGYLKSRPPFIT